MAPLKSGGRNSFAWMKLADGDLAARQDPREVISDPHAGYVGIAVSERALVPDDNAQLGEAHFEDWLNKATNKPGSRSAAGVSTGEAQL